MRAFGRLVLVCVLVLGFQGTALADKAKVSLGTATKGGGFEVFGGGAAQVVNETDPTLEVTPVATKGSRENIPLLEARKLDTALVASLPAYEAFNGVGRTPTNLKIITAIYSTFGMFAVRGDSTAKSFRDLVGKPVAWGTKSSGLTLLGKYVSEALHRGHGVLAGRLKQARETTPENTVLAAPTPGHIHPGVRKYLSEIGLQ